MKGNNIIKDTEIYMLAQFIDVLEEIENFKSLEEVKEDIKNRKKIYKKEIKDMTSSDEIFDLDEIDKIIGTKEIEEIKDTTYELLTEEDIENYFLMEEYEDEKEHKKE